jgi:hypothetical protein
VGVFLSYFSLEEKKLQINPTKRKRGDPDALDPLPDEKTKKRDPRGDGRGDSDMLITTV